MNLGPSVRAISLVVGFWFAGACGGRTDSSPPEGVTRPDTTHDGGSTPTPFAEAEAAPPLPIPPIDYATPPTAIPDGSSWQAPFGAPPSAPDSSLPPAPLFDWMRRAIVGDWIGTRTNPWDPPATVRIHFDASQSYTAHCVDANCSVWHYGIDDDLPNKQYQLYDLHADGTGLGRIFVAFSATDALEGRMDSITISADQQSLSFNFYPDWLGRTIGPVHFDLTRTNAQGDASIAATGDASQSSTEAGVACETPPNDAGNIATYRVAPINPAACRPLVGVLLQPPSCRALCHAHFCCCKVYEDSSKQVMVECATLPECPATGAAC
jgi:hypothetical protein